MISNLADITYPGSYYILRFRMYIHGKKGSQFDKQILYSSSSVHSPTSVQRTYVPEMDQRETRLVM